MTDCFVGFDTSNYTTSVALCDADGQVIANLKTPLSVKAGERGLRQSDAVFAHTKNLPALCDLLKERMAREGYRPLAVGCSVRPRDAADSYMPCFLAGKSAAHAFGAALGIPVYECSHQNGHVMAALYSCGRGEELLGRDKPFFAFHVSGGTTEVLLVEPRGEELRVTLIGETDDLNGGQVIDRVGVSMGLEFPCGRELERLAASYRGRIRRHPVCVREGRCSLSGAENLALKIWRETEDRGAAAAFVFDFLGRTLLEMGQAAIARYGEAPILFAGGVMSNRLMRDRLSAAFDAAYAEPEFSADNAAGIALLCRRWALRSDL